MGQSDLETKFLDLAPKLASNLDSLDLFPSGGVEHHQFAAFGMGQEHAPAVWRELQMVVALMRGPMRECMGPVSRRLRKTRQKLYDALTSKRRGGMMSLGRRNLFPDCVRTLVAGLAFNAL